MNIVAIIPAHLASVRFPRKILFPFHGLPMIEHVRRRALLSTVISDVYVATCDEEIAEVVQGFGGKVIMTANTHRNGTTRAADAALKIDCSHVMLLQGDEPLLLPRHVNVFANAIKLNPEGDAWNATALIENEEELDRHSFVKCTVTQSNKIVFCFRRTPCFSTFSVQQTFVRKILGIIAYRKDFLVKLAKMLPTTVEEAELIEQMRIIESGYSLQSVPVSPSLPSVNEPEEAEIVLEYIRKDDEQRELLDRVMCW